MESVMKEDLVRIVARLYTLKDEIEDNNTRQKLELEETIDDLERMILDGGQEKDLEEIAERAKWVCSICGKNTFDVDFDYIGSAYNHLGCELEVESNNSAGINPNIAEDVDESDKDKPMVFDDEDDAELYPWHGKPHEEEG